MLLATKIPIVYHHLLPALLDIEIPEERLANCSDCNLCQTPKSPYLKAKCCNYHPVQPNFLVGALLTDEDPGLAEGRKRILEQLQCGEKVSKLGLKPDAAYSSNQNRILTQDQAFQTREELETQLCPYYDQGNCSVWKYREHLCVTYFCSSIGGKNGHLFWRKLDALLKTLEDQLAEYVGGQLKGSFDTLAEQLAYFKKSYDLVQNMSPEQFEKNICENLSEEIKQLKELALAFRQHAFPEYLSFPKEIEIQNLGDHKILLRLDDKETEISAVVYSLLRLFDGKRSTSEVFRKAFSVLYNLNDSVDELIGLGMLREEL